MTKRLDNAVRGLRGEYVGKPKEISGSLGITSGGKQVVSVPGRAGYVYVRLNNNLSELVQAFNTAVSPVYDLPVIVQFVNSQYRVMGRDVERYTSYWGNQTPYLPVHGTQHSFGKDATGGGDPVWVYSDQFMPLLAFPSGSDTAGTVLIGAYTYNWFGVWKYAGNTGAPSISSYLPTGSSSARMLLLYLEGASGNPKYTAGVEFDGTLTGSAAIVPYLPTLSPSLGIPLAGVRIITGTSTIGWENLYDVRQFYGREQASSGGGIGVTVESDGAYVATGTNMNFVGDGVTVTASGTNIRVYIPILSGTGGAESFVELSDTPDSLTGTYAGQMITVNASGTALEFGTGTVSELRFIDPWSYTAPYPAAINGDSIAKLAVRAGHLLLLHSDYAGAGYHVITKSGFLGMNGKVVDYSSTTGMWVLDDEDFETHLNVQAAASGQKPDLWAKLPSGSYYNGPHAFFNSTTGSILHIVDWAGNEVTRIPPTGTAVFVPNNELGFGLVTGRTDWEWGFNVMFGDGSGTFPVGTQVPPIEIPYRGQIEQWTLMADVTGSLQLRVWRSTYDGFPPTSGGLILSPVLSSQRKDRALFGVSGTTLNFGDILQVYVESVTTIKQATLSVRGRRI